MFIWMQNNKEDMPTVGIPPQKISEMLILLYFVTIWS